LLETLKAALDETYPELLIAKTPMPQHLAGVYKLESGDPTTTAQFNSLTPEQQIQIYKQQLQIHKQQRQSYKQQLQIHKQQLQIHKQQIQIYNTPSSKPLNNPTPFFCPFLLRPKL